jgi:hypothetical protein
MPNGSLRLAEYPAAIILAVGLLVSACGTTEEEVTPTGDGLYKTVAWHPLFAQAAVDRAFDNAEAFCAQKNKINSVRKKEIIKEWYGVYVHRWFLCLGP